MEFGNSASSNTRRLTRLSSMLTTGSSSIRCALFISVSIRMES
ncbi:MAG: hypothetical protein EOM90_00095 [Alphaproteobacteria bacterium]|nr:hypothetical protein [Alphaproteobacteria bacterium]